MVDKYYSADDISAMLGIHPKTTRRCITQGKLRAAKLGKQYRISGHELSVFMEAYGGTAAQDDTQAACIDVSAVVDIAAPDQDHADRISSSVLAAANSKDLVAGKCTASVQQNGNKLRVMLWITISFITAMVACINLLDQNK